MKIILVFIRKFQVKKQKVKGSRTFLHLIITELVAQHIVLFHKVPKFRKTQSRYTLEKSLRSNMLGHRSTLKISWIDVAFI